MRSPIYPISPTEYLESKAKGEIRHEYVAGEIFASLFGTVRTHHKVGGILFKIN